MNRVPFSSFSTFSRLFKDYTENFEKLAPYFAGDYRNPDHLRRAARLAAEQHPDRGVLVSVLRSQAESFGLAESSAALIDKLADPACVAIVTGQQLGLFGGPLYTLYKIVTAIQVAEKFEEDFGRSAVPVFWLEGEDHDFEEIASTVLLAGSVATRINYDPDNGQNLEMATGRLLLRDEIIATIDELEALLQPTEFKDGVMEIIRTAYAPGQTMLQAFVSVINAVLGPGRVVFVSPDDPDLKSLVSPLFEHEIRDSATSSKLLKQVSAELEDEYHVQVRTRPLNLFIHGDLGRASIDVTDAGFESRDDRLFTEASLLDFLKTDPGVFSPNVVMRPLMQDTVLPTAVYIAGPGEIAYFAQFKPLYEWAGIAMPVIYPRASATILEKRISKVIDKYNLDIPRFEEQWERLFRDIVVEQMDGDLDGDFKAAASHLHRAIDDIKPIIEHVDRSLVRTAEATLNSFMKEWTRLKVRVVRAERQQQDVVKEALGRASSSLFPFGLPQERALSPLYFLNKYGPDFGQTLINTLDLDTTSHQVIET